MATPFAALAPAFAEAAGGVLSSLFGRSAEKKAWKRQQQAFEMQRQASREDYIWQTGEGLKHLVAGAQAAGFNPLTVLRGGGGAGYQQTHTPILSMSAYQGANIGDALAAGLQTGVQAAFDYNPIDEEKAQLELQIMQGQLRRINRENDMAVTRIGGAPTATGSRFKLSRQSPPTQGETTVTNPLPLGWHVNPKLVDAEAWERRYGDIAQEVGGGINAVGDTYYNQAPVLNRSYSSISRSFRTGYRNLARFVGSAIERSERFKRNKKRERTSKAGGIGGM